MMMSQCPPLGKMIMFALRALFVAAASVCSASALAFELVHGPSDVLRLVQTLKPKYVVPMQNGDVDAEGLASSLVQSVGSPEEFRAMLNKAQRPDERQVEVINTIPGEEIVLNIL